MHSPPVRRPAPRRRAAIASLALLGVLALLAGWWWFMPVPAAEPTATLFALRARPPGAAAPAPAPVDLVASAPARRKPGADEAEVCGVGIYKLADLAAGRVGQPYTLPDIKQVGEALIQSLAARPEPHARAAALLAQAAAPSWNGAREAEFIAQYRACGNPESAASSAADPACQADAARREQLHRAEEFAATEPGTQLVALAQRSNDPALLALANDFCAAKQYAGIAACSADLLTPWARLEPGNAQPWLYMLDRARYSGDSNAAAEALYHLSLSTYQRGYKGAVMPWLLRDVPAEQRNVVDLMRSRMASGIGMLRYANMGADISLVDACATAKVQDGNRRQLCMATAETLVKSADNVMTGIMGAVVGKRAGWSEERFQSTVVPLKAVLQAYQKMEMAKITGMQSLSCDALEEDSLRWKMLNQLGELELWRRAVLGSGKTMEEVVQDYQRDGAARKPAAK